MISAKLRIYSVFSSFLRQMIEIIISSFALGFVLAIVILTLAVCFNLQSDDLSGFMMALINSYRLSLGDFNIIDNQSEREVIFWILFILGTIISMLVLLNMVIAVMSEAFTKV